MSLKRQDGGEALSQWHETDMMHNERVRYPWYCVWEAYSSLITLKLAEHTSMS